MVVALEELHFGLQTDWITPSSRCFRPSCWPPARDWVVSEAKDGSIISRWGDAIWDLGPLLGKPLSLNFGDGPGNIPAPIDQANSDLLRLIATWFIWGNRPVRTGGTLKLAFQNLRPIVALCSNAGVMASNLMHFPKLLEQVPGVIAPSAYNTTLFHLHRLLDAQEKLGFILVDTEGLKRLALADPGHEKVQTAYIPPRIWTYQVTRLRECLNDFLEHRQSIEDCFNFCLDAYANNYGSLTKALTSSPVNSRQPFTIPLKPNAGRKSGCTFHGPFFLTAERFGIEELLCKWLELGDKRVELRQLGSYLTLIQWVGVAYIANFTLQRIEEVTTLRTDCLEFETDEKLGRIPIICGETTKTVQDSDARWPTSPSVKIAIEALSAIAQFRMRCITANPFISSVANELAKPYLLAKSFEPWCPKPKTQHYSYNKQPMAYGSVVKTFPKLFDSQELMITEADLRVAQMLTPQLPEDEFAVGLAWPLAWHQLRRTGAVNMFASGMLSDTSIQFLMKHSSRLMPLYYGRGYTKLHLNEEVEALVTKTMYEVMAKSMLNALSDRFVSPRSEEQKQDIVVNLIGTRDAKKLAIAAQRGEVYYRETRLGACTSRTLCSYGGIESVARCAGGDGHKPCIDVLYDRTKASIIEKDLVQVNHELTALPANSPRHNALLMERKGLENFLNVIKR